MKMPSTFLTPYLYFSGECREAMAFYQQVFGGELSVLTFGAADPSAPESLKDKVMHANIMDGPIKLMACDDPEGKTHGLGNIRLTLHGKDRTELEAWYDQLSAEGTIIHALQQQMWGDVYGEVTDRFGIRWMFNIAGN